MRRFARPIVVVSRCLEFTACRYDGKIATSQFVAELRKYIRFIAVCPELEIGLGVPRDRILIVEQVGKCRLIQPSTGRDFTARMARFATNYLRSLGDIDGFILKSRSPSCGVRDTKILQNPHSQRFLRKDSGIFGARVKELFHGPAVEDERRLTIPRIREHFLARLYTLAHFRKVKRSESAKQLLRFHFRNKLLFSSYHQRMTRSLEKTINDSDSAAGGPFAAMIAEYEKRLHRLFARPARRPSNMRVLMLAFESFADKLSRGERRGFRELLRKYRADQLPLAAARKVLRELVARHELRHLQEQTFLEPYPEELSQL